MKGEGTNALIETLSTRFYEAGNLDRAEKMAAYMKGRFVFHGIPSPARNEIQKEWFSAIKSANINPWQLIDFLWDMEQREFQYVAIDLLKKLPKKAFQIDDIYKLEQLIASKSWWDTVDIIASNALGTYFQRFPEQIDPVINEWRYDDNMWLNRSCLIFQLKYKNAVDFELLKSLIVQYQGNLEFFIQKAIGWSLRQYSKFQPNVVREFIEEIQLTGLAKREGSKYL